MVPRFGRGHWFWIHTRRKRVQSFGDRRSKLVQASKKIGSQASGGEASAGPSGLARGRGRSGVYGGEGPGGGNALPRSAGAAGQALSEAGPVLGKGTEIGTGACATSSTCSRRRSSGSGAWAVGSPQLRPWRGVPPPCPPFYDGRAVLWAKGRKLLSSVQSLCLHSESRGLCGLLARCAAPEVETNSATGRPQQTNRREAPERLEVLVV